MAYRTGERMQATLFPQSIEEYVSQKDPVRVYDVFVEAVDFGGLGIELNDNKVGCPQYEPRSMLKLLIYGYSYGIRSSRELERATYHNVSFIWLVKGLRPDHKTIANFRRDNQDAIKKVIKQCARICIKLNLIDLSAVCLCVHADRCSAQAGGNKLFLDGSKIRANVRQRRICLWHDIYQ